MSSSSRSLRAVRISKSSTSRCAKSTKTWSSTSPSYNSALKSSRLATLSRGTSRLNKWSAIDAMATTVAKKRRMLCATIHAKQSTTARRILSRLGSRRRTLTTSIFAGNSLAMIKRIRELVTGWLSIMPAFHKPTSLLITAMACRASKKARWRIVVTASARACSLTSKQWSTITRRSQTTLTWWVTRRINWPKQENHCSIQLWGRRRSLKLLQKWRSMKWRLIRRNRRWCPRAAWPIVQAILLTSPSRAGLSHTRRPAISHVACPDLAQFRARGVGTPQARRSASENRFS